MPAEGSMTVLMTQWLGVVAESAIRGSLIIGVAAALAWLLRRRAAALRSAVWHVVGCAVLMLPVLSAVLPRWRVEVTPVVRDAGLAVVSRMVGRERSLGGAEPSAAQGSSLVGDDPLPPVTSGATRLAPVPNVTGMPAVIAALFALWLLGALIVAGQMALSLYRVARIERRSRTVVPVRVARQAGAMFETVRAKGRLRVLEGPAHIAPMTWGILRPCVLLPAGWDQWPTSVMAAVLAHELAHVRRRDLARQLPWDAARVLFWFNPLVALAARQSHLAREQACDDEVIGRGLPPANYADALLALVRVLRGVDAAGVTALAGGGASELAKRIAALVDSSRVRCVSRATTLATVSLVTMVTVASSTVSLAAETHRLGSALDTRDGGLYGDCCRNEHEPTVVGEVGRALDSAFAPLSKRGLSGTVLVSTQHQVVFAKGFGFADRLRRVPAAVDTRYHVAGITKAFTAAAVADLIDRGLVSASAPVARFLPELRGPAGDVTVHQLLTHTDGLGDVGAFTSAADASAFLVSLGSVGAAFMPGTSYRSTDVGHSVLAALVERVAGQPFATYLRSRFLVPASMTRSYFRFDGTPPAEPAAVGYAEGEASGPVKPDVDPWGVRGSRGLVTTVDDLRRWYAALVGGRLVRQPALDLMFTPYLRTEKPFEQGYGWLLYDDRTAPPFRGGPVPVRRRSGREAGFEAELVHDPNGGWLAVVLLNADDGRRLDALGVVRAVMNAHPPPAVAMR